MNPFIRDDDSAVEDFANESGVYSCPSVGLSSFANACIQYGYRMECTIATHTLHDSVLIDIFRGDEVAGYCHVAWCQRPDGRYCVTGQVAQ